MARTPEPIFYEFIDMAWVKAMGTRFGTVVSHDRSLNLPDRGEVEAAVLDETVRGASGFGSTGVVDAAVPARERAS